MAGFSCAEHRRYSAGCPNCRRIDSHYDRRRRRALAAGTWQHPVAPDAVIKHIAHLRDAGMSLTAIARAASVSPSTVFPIASGARTFIHGPTAAAILSVQPARVLPAGLVDATGSGRRIRALVTAGYSLTDLGRRIGRCVQPVWEIAWDRQSAVSIDLAAAISDLYEQLSGTAGPSTRARNDGRRHGWSPPDDWDAATIDDPEAQPFLDEIDDGLVDEVAVLRTLRGERLRLTPTERVVVAAELHRRGKGASAIARTIGCSGTAAAKLVGQAARQAQPEAA